MFEKNEQKIFSGTISYILYSKMETKLEEFVLPVLKIKDENRQKIILIYDIILRESLFSKYL